MTYKVSNDNNHINSNNDNKDNNNENEEKKMKNKLLIYMIKIKIKRRRYINENATCFEKRKGEAIVKHRYDNCKSIRSAKTKMNCRAEKGESEKVGRTAIRQRCFSFLLWYLSPSTTEATALHFAIIFSVSNWLL